MAVCCLAVREIIDWEDLKGISWGIFLIIGAGLSLGDALVRTGVTEWFAVLIGPLVTGPSLLVTLLLLVTISALLTNLLNNNTTIAAVFVPVLIALAGDNPNLDPVLLAVEKEPCYRDHHRRSPPGALRGGGGHYRQGRHQ
jgi:sodium-dependent dicarboxylate transporter 2/3/5